jgi:phosphoglycerol transferase MdoB-like AlkP superfamily enzyme
VKTKESGLFGKIYGCGNWFFTRAKDLAFNTKSFLLLLTVAFFYVLQQSFLFGYSFSVLELLPLAFSLFPVLGAWLVFRILMTPIQSAALIGLIVSVISWVSLAKTARTNLPLSWNDMFVTGDLVFFFRYVEPSLLVFVIGALGFLVIFSFVLQKPKVSKVRLAASIFPLSAIGLLIFFPFGQGESSWQLRNFLMSQGVSYTAWDWNQNVSKNGIVLHLLQTSMKPLLSEPSFFDKNEYSNLSKVNQDSNSYPGEEVPETVVVILCESCWYDSDNFRDAFDPLFSIGFQDTRVISPVYGGGTVNASLEILTGLPMASRHVGGVVYQEYADLLSPNVRSLASSFRDEGYVTVAAHNWQRSFWRRDEVKPKLGFEEFFSIEQMVWDGQDYPRDQVMFQHVLSKVEFGETKNFLYLTTMFGHSPYGGNGVDASKHFSDKISATAMDIKEFSLEVLSAKVKQLLFPPLRFSDR